MGHVHASAVIFYAESAGVCIYFFGFHFYQQLAAVGAEFEGIGQ
jgi:hypothetical protein